MKMARDFRNWNIRQMDFWLDMSNVRLLFPKLYVLINCDNKISVSENLCSVQFFCLTYQIVKLTPEEMHHILYNEIIFACKRHQNINLN